MKCPDRYAVYQTTKDREFIDAHVAINQFIAGVFGTNDAALRN
jgi:hypothetical protein